MATFGRVTSFLPLGFREAWETRPAGAHAKEGWLPGGCEATAQPGERLGISVGLCRDSEAEPAESLLVSLVPVEPRGAGGERWVMLPLTLFFRKCYPVFPIVSASV